MGSDRFDQAFDLLIDGFYALRAVLFFKATAGGEDHIDRETAISMRQVVVLQATGDAFQFGLNR